MSELKNPRLFYFDEGNNGYVEAPHEVVALMIDPETDLRPGEERQITFKRFDMTDEEMENLPCDSGANND